MYVTYNIKRLELYDYVPLLEHSTISSVEDRQEGGGRVQKLTTKHH